MLEMAKNKISRDEYKKMLKNKGAGKPRALRTDNSKAKVLRQTIFEIQGLLPSCKNFLFAGGFTAVIKIVRYRRADVDNVGKGSLDSLQGSAYGNDRDCEDSRSYRDNAKGVLQ